MNIKHQQWSYITTAPYSIAKFIGGVKEENLKYREILEEIKREMDGVFSVSHRAKGADAERARRSEEYIEALQKFESFLMYGKFRPSTTSYEGRLFFSVVKMLVERGEFDHTRLDIERRIESLVP